MSDCSATTLPLSAKLRRIFTSDYSLHLMHHFFLFCNLKAGQTVMSDYFSYWLHSFNSYNTSTQTYQQRRIILARKCTRLHTCKSLLAICFFLLLLFSLTIYVMAKFRLFSTSSICMYYTMPVFHRIQNNTAFDAKKDIIKLNIF